MDCTISIDFSCVFVCVDAMQCNVILIKKRSVSVKRTVIAKARRAHRYIFGNAMPTFIFTPFATSITKKQANAKRTKHQTFLYSSFHLTLELLLLFCILFSTMMRMMLAFAHNINSVCCAIVSRRCYSLHVTHNNTTSTTQQQQQHGTT